MFHYSICSEPDDILFRKQCVALERTIPKLEKGALLRDVDGSLVQLYKKDGQELSVHNSYYSGALYVESEFDLRVYFPEAKTGYS